MGARCAIGVGARFFHGRLAAFGSVTVTLLMLMLMMTEMLASLVGLMHAIRARSSPAELEKESQCDDVEKAFDHGRIIRAPCAGFLALLDQ